jgi:hypothetical protein
VPPRSRPVVLLLPCLLAALLLAFPAWASAASVCAGTNPGDPTTAATDSTTPPAGWQTGAVSVALTGTGVAHWEWMVDCGPVQSGPTVSSAPVAGNGTVTLTHRAVDAFSLATDWTDSTVQLDSTAPVNTTVVPDPTDWQGVVPVVVHVTGTDSTSSVSQVMWNLDGLGWSPSAPGSPGSTVSISSTGTHILQTAVIDAANNASAVRTDTILIDTVLPIDTTSTPVGWQHAATTVNVTGTDADSGVGVVEWKLDGVQSAGGNNSSVVIPEGSHVLQTRILDDAGNASSWVSHTVMVDTTGPADTTAVPAGWQTTAPVVVHVTGTDTGSGVDHVDWNLDGVTGTGPSNSPVTITGEGDHVLTTWITDSVGDVSSPRTQHVFIDTLVPSDVTVAAAGWQTTALAVTITGTDATSGVEHVEWQIDGGTIQTFAGNPHTITISADGQHTLKTRVFDNAGLGTGWKTTIVRIDTTAPTNLTPVASATWRSSSYGVTVDGSDGGSDLFEMRWQIDGGPQQSGPGGSTVSVSGNGAHTLTTWAVDVAGNASGLRVDHINIDNVLPTDTTSPPGAPVGNNVAVPVTGTDALAGVNHVEWKIDGGSVQSGASGSTAVISGAGPHTLQTQVVDNAGNATGFRSATVTIDLSLSNDIAAPTDTSTTVGTAWRTTAVPVTVAATDAGVGVDHVEWRLDGAPIVSGASGSVVTVSGDGSHRLETRAVDLVGNTSGWRLQLVKIDTVVPVDASVLPPDWANTRTFTLSGVDGNPTPGVVTSGVDKIEYQIDGGTVTTTSAPSGALAITLTSDGTHTIGHRIIDLAGQASAWKTDTVKIDTIVPVNTSGASPTGWQTSAFALTLAGTDVGSGVDHAEWRVDSGATQTGTPAAIAADGTHVLETRSVDKAGNASSWRSETVKVDLTPPSNDTPAPAAPWQSATYSVTVAGSDTTSGIAGVQWTLDGGATQTTTSVTISAAGPHTLMTRVLDAAGNASAWRTDTIGIDHTAPTLAVSCGTIEWRNAPAACTVSSDGGESGLPTLTAARGDAAAAAVSGGAYSVDADGTWSLTFRAVDGAGNEKLALAQVKIDRTPPVATLTCATSLGLTYVCHAAGADALSGLASLTYSVNGSSASAPGGDGTFAVFKGTVVAHAVDRAGNAADSAPITLADRTPVATPAPTPTPTPEIVPRQKSEAVLRNGSGSVGARALGELEVSSAPERTTVDLRPLALGKGKFKILLKIQADKSSKTTSKTVTTKSGYSPRITVKLAGAARVRVKLTVQRRSGRHWIMHASGSAALG